MAELIRNIPPNFFLDFLSAEEEENLLWEGEDEDDFVLISTTCIYKIFKTVRAFSLVDRCV